MNHPEQTSVQFFNIRVYALIIEGDKILLSYELVQGKKILKFPGGGVEPGEGIIDALQRESQEELKQLLQNIDHFYTTDFFQKSSFNHKDQIISVYYTAELSRPDQIIKNFKDPKPDKPVFIWRKIDEIKTQDLHFPIDKHVLSLLTY